MAGKFDAAQLNEIASANDIVDVIGSYIPLKRTGKSYKARCPFHDEKTPSFNVSPEIQRFKCFGCGKSGSVFGFVMEMERLSFPESVEFLARRAGIPIAHSSGGSSEFIKRERVVRANEATREFFAKWLSAPSGLVAREYLQRRGFDESTIRSACIGYAPEGWQTLLDALASIGISREEALEAGLAVENERGKVYDRFRNRVTFAIRDPHGRVVGFGARTLGDEHPKYLNSPETPVFNKSALLYGLHEGRDSIIREGHALLMEGYTDVIACRMKGVDNCCATLGTALTNQHLKLLKRYADRVVLVYDGDDAGIKAAERSLPLFIGEEMQASVIILPEGADPFDFVMREGGAALKTLVDRAASMESFFVSSLHRAYDLSNPHEKLKAVGAVADMVARIPEPMKRDVWLSEFSQLLGVDKASFRATVTAKMDVAAARSGGAQTPSPNGQQARIAVRKLSVETAALAALVASPELLDRFAPLLSKLGFADENAAVLWAHMLQARAVDEKWEPVFWRTLDTNADVSELEAAMMVTKPDAERNEATITALLARGLKATAKARMAEIKEKLKTAQEEGDEWVIEELLRELAEVKREMKNNEGRY